MRWYHAATLLLGLFCSCDKTGELGKGKSDGDDDDGEEVPGTEGAEADDFDPSDANGGLCKTDATQSVPADVTMTCKLNDGTSLNEFELKLKPRADSIKVYLDGVEIGSDKFTYDPETNFVQINDDFTQSEVKITYTSADEVETDDSGTAATGKIVDATGLDGCGLMIELEDGKRLEPTNLPATFAKAGIIVTFQYVVQTDVASACMAGKIVTVSDMAGDPKDCASQSLIIEAAMEQLAKAPKTCATADDCVLVNGSSASCSVPKAFTKAAYTDALRTVVEGAVGKAAAVCAFTQSICTDTHSVTCTASLCTKAN